MKIEKSIINLVNNLSELIHKIECKYRQNDKKGKLEKSNVTVTTVFLNMQTLNLRKLGVQGIFDPASCSFSKNVFFRAKVIQSRGFL